MKLTRLLDITLFVVLVAVIAFALSALTGCGDNAPPSGPDAGVLDVCPDVCPDPVCHTSGLCSCDGGETFTCMGSPSEFPS